MKRLLLVLLLAAAPMLARADGSRRTMGFDSGWKFNLGDTPSASAVSFNDRSWRSLDLPHDWSIEGENLEDNPGGGKVGYFPSGIGWYRKTFSVSGYSPSKKYSIEFDGVYMNSEVWINGHHLGRWPYGYSSFSYDLTPYLKARGNVIAVRVDNSMQPNSRWYSGSGIYRHVRLVETSAVHFAKWGVYVTTASLSSSSATLEVEMEIEGGADGMTVRNVLYDRDGNVAGQAEGQVSAGSARATLTVSEPHPWSLDDPNLYTLKSYIYASSGREMDCVLTDVGIRTLEYDVDRGFFLNGEHVKMYGVNLHHDGGAVGAAVPERVWERRLEILKSGGCNAVRTAHNAPSPEFLDICDRLGMMVMDEAFDMWQEGKNDYDYHVEFSEWYEKDLTAMVKRDRNHPSVVMWSIGNEIPDQSSKVGPELARKMIGICHQLDHTRPVTSGNDRIVADDTPATEEFLAEFANDIVGYNYPDRWRTRRETNYTEDKIRFPSRRVMATESGGIGGSRGQIGRQRVQTRPMAGNTVQNPSASYIDVEQRWRYALINDFVIGDFMWTGIDYYGETWWPSRGASSGYLDNCGFKKDGYWFFKSIWTDEPVLHLVGGWNKSGDQIGKITQVVVFTNCASVELFVNGRSYGTKTKEFPRKGNVNTWNGRPADKVNTSTADLHLTWDVEYQPGEVKLVGKKGDGEIVEVYRTASAPASFRASVDREVIKADPADVAHVTVEILDANGTVVPSADNLVTFSAPGAEIIGVESGNMSDLSSTKAPQRKAFAGMCLGIVQAKKAGQYVVDVTVEGLGTKQVYFTAE